MIENYTRKSQSVTVKFFKTAFHKYIKPAIIVQCKEQ